MMGDLGLACSDCVVAGYHSATSMPSIDTDVASAQQWASAKLTTAGASGHIRVNPNHLGVELL